MFRPISSVLFTFTIFLTAFMGMAHAQQREGDYLYRVETLRAATGKLEALLEWAASAKDAGYFRDAYGADPLIMRHSQGDQWDLMVFLPMESWEIFYSKQNSKRLEKARDRHKDLLNSQSGLIAFEEDHFAYGPPMDVVAADYDVNGLYHIEMFHAAPGKESELLNQRRMENAYLADIGLTTNMIFRRGGGSDVDVFTVGFHQNLAAFAADPDATGDEREAAAIAAGFKDRADISFHLRSLLSAHHDTLAVKVE